MAEVTTAGEGLTRSRKVLLYFGPLTLLVYLVLPHGYLLDIATAYMLKNQLHATATQVSIFRLLTGRPRLSVVRCSASRATCGIRSACATAAIS